MEKTFPTSILFLMPTLDILITMPWKCKRNHRLRPLGSEGNSGKADFTVARVALFAFEGTEITLPTLPIYLGRHMQCEKSGPSKCAPTMIAPTIETFQHSSSLVIVMTNEIRLAPSEVLFYLSKFKGKRNWFALHFGIAPRRKKLYKIE